METNSTAITVRALKGLFMTKRTAKILMSVMLPAVIALLAIACNASAVWGG
jgi:hypothetical protein